MKIVGIDFEASGLVPSEARIIEVGALTWIVSDASGIQHMPALSSLVVTEGLCLSPEVVEVTGITDKMLHDSGYPLADVLVDLVALCEDADYLMAHNAAYDRPLLEAECRRLGVENEAAVAKMLATPWICTLTDIQHPAKFKCRTLSHLALDYGVPVNPKELHRAVTDVLLMIKMVQASGKLAETIALLDVPWVVLSAKIQAPWEDGGKGKEAATKLGFSWERAKGDETVWPKQWVRRVKECHVEKLKAEASFKVVLAQKNEVLKNGRSAKNSKR